MERTSLGPSECLKIERQTEVRKDVLINKHFPPQGKNELKFELKICFYMLSHVLKAISEIIGVLNIPGVLISIFRILQGENFPDFRVFCIQFCKFRNIEIWIPPTVNPYYR